MNNNIGNNIRRIRLIKNIKQEYLAKKIGISRNTLSAIENGSKSPTIFELNQIALQLGVDLRYLLDFAELIK
jgi:transcriptional regulator with XRE-family HTH domain